MELVKNGPFTGLGRGHYGCISIDPPWQYRAGGNRKPPYPTMPLPQILALPVGELAAPDCALFCWTSGPFLEWSMDCLEAWGFTFKTYAFVWVKTWPRETGRLFVDWQETLDDSTAMGTGHWTRSNAEMVLLGTRGRPQRRAADVPQVIVAPRMEHSRKPEGVTDAIERLVDGPRVEIFARRSRPGWDVWGNQTNKFDAPALAVQS